jgi:hypothetical protein
MAQSSAFNCAFHFGPPCSRPWTRKSIASNPPREATPIQWFGTMGTSMPTSNPYDFNRRSPIIAWRISS